MMALLQCLIINRQWIPHSLLRCSLTSAESLPRRPTELEQTNCNGELQSPLQFVCSSSPTRRCNGELVLGLARILRHDADI